MVKIIWSPLSRNNLKRIFEYISADSPEIARKFINKLIRQVKILEKFPLSGKKVSELLFSENREIIYKSYRIIYYVEEDVVQIITIIHSKQDFFSAYSNSV